MSSNTIIQIQTPIKSLNTNPENIKGEKQLDELRRWYEVTLDREGRVLELKQEVNELLKQHGEALRYGNT